MKNQRLVSAMICLILIVALIPARVVIATPQAIVTSGTLQVNTASDIVTSDNFLSLREAMRVVMGTLTGPFTLAERTQMSGCTFSSGGILTGGCGTGGDTINFAPGLVEILLTSRLPIIDRNGTTINGAVSAGNMIINANAVVDYGFEVSADDVIIENLTIINISGFGAAIGLTNGLFKGLQIYNNYLGVLPTSTLCTDPAITVKPYVDLLISFGGGFPGTGAGTAYIDNNVIGCSKNSAITLNSAPYVYIGQTISGQMTGNWLGVSHAGANLGNGGFGISVCCSAVVTGTQILGNRIGYNTSGGILLGYIVNTIINNNDIFHNTGAGIDIYDTSTTTMNNNLSHDNDSSGILLEQANPSPLVTTQNVITGGAFYHNGAAGISEGNGAGNNTWSQISTFANAGLGIDTLDNGTPDPPALTLTGTTPTSPGVLVHGTLDVPLVFLFYTYHIELYLVSPDPSGYGEGIQYIGSTDVVWNLANDYTWSIPNPLGAGCYTATLTVRPDFTPSDTYSSEFSANLGTKCFLEFIPSVIK
jgi:hypothetical protein